MLLDFRENITALSVRWVTLACVFRDKYRHALEISSNARLASDLEADLEADLESDREADLASTLGSDTR
ncbi:hypothetical protein PUN4_420074 [Paraburkholderia unamae]|jgi:hypothetical protein|nr:hypothetical protein PUN4_420074 [Paraburkholderia unamae]